MLLDLVLIRVFFVDISSQVSGANLVVHDSKPGSLETLVVVSGAPDKTHAAQSLIHAFILCGQTQV